MNTVLRRIAHLDMDAFYASVELEKWLPHLRSRRSDCGNCDRPWFTIATRDVAPFVAAGVPVIGP